MDLALKSLSAQLLFLSLLFVSYSLGVRLLSGITSTSVRLCAIYVVFCWISTMLAHLLLATGSFRPIPALLAAVFLTVGTRAGGVRRSEVVAALGDDFSRIQSAVRGSSGRARFGLALLAAVASIALLRVLLLPLLGWDTMTYHGVKAGIWAQTGRDVIYDAPAAWEYYKSFFGGGELLTAWAMMPFGSDVLAGLPDWIHWLALGLAAYVLGRDVGARHSTAVLFAGALLTSPAVVAYVGSGYVDTQLNASLLIAVVFLARWSPRRGPSGLLLLAGASLGLAVGVKSSGALFAAVALMAVLCRMALNFSQSRHTFRDLVIFVSLLALPSVRWCILNFADSGYPLGAVPASIGPIRLGVATPSLASLLSLPAQAYTLAVESQQLGMTLRPFAAFMIFPTAGLLALKAKLKRRPWMAALLLLVTGATLVLYFSPDFSIIRLFWIVVNARFLVPAVVAMGVFGLPASGNRPAVTAAIELLACAAIAIHAAIYIGEFAVSAPVNEMAAVATGFLAAVGVAMGIRCLPQAVWARPFLKHAVVAMLAVSMGIVGLHQCRSWLRRTAYASSEVLHGFPRYWVDGIGALAEEEPGMKQIAVTAGPNFLGHHWFVYPFMGADLENRIAYVSPLRDGSANFAAWAERLRADGISHIMSFEPAGVELRWMEGDHSTQFARLAGVPKRWGLFRVGLHPPSLPQP